MTKQQKLDQVLDAVLEVIKHTSGDTLRYKDCRHTMSDQTYAAIERLHTAYRELDFFKYEETACAGIDEASWENNPHIKETNEQRADYTVQGVAVKAGRAD